MPTSRDQSVQRPAHGAESDFPRLLKCTQINQTNLSAIEIGYRHSFEQ